MNLLKVLRNRKDFASSIGSLAVDSYDSYTRYMLKWYAAYFKAYPVVNEIVMGDLLSLIKLKTPSMTPEQATVIERICVNVSKPISDEVRAVTLSGLAEREFSKRIETLIAAYNDEQEIDILHEIKMLVTRANERDVGADNPTWCDTDIDELLRLNADTSGYMFDFLPITFSSQLKGLREADNICVAADTDKGKTGFMCRIAASFAKQRPQIYQAYLNMINDPAWVEPQGFRHMVEFRPVLYLVNEGTAEQVTPRIYQTVLETTQEALSELSAKGGGLVQEAYAKALHGRADAIRVKNIHGWSLSDVLKEIEKHNAFLVITDMTGRIGYGGSKSDIDKVEAVWNDLRAASSPEMLDFIHVGSAQLSAEGKNMLQPPLSALQNSKTGIQTTLDLALWIGSVPDPIDDIDRSVRSLTTPKNKRARSGSKSFNYIELQYDGEHNRYE